MRRARHAKTFDSYQQRQSWKFSSLDHRNGKTFVDTGSSMNVAELAGNHQQRQDGNGISSGDGSGTTSDARGLSILDDGMFADDQQQRQSWNESSSPAIRTFD